MSSQYELHVDYNGDLEDVLKLLVELTGAMDVTKDFDAFSPCYHLRSELWNCTISLHEDSGVYDVGSPYAGYRFNIDVYGEEETGCITDLCNLLQSRNDIAFQMWNAINLPDFVHRPMTFKPVYSVITRHMPAVIMIKTRLKNKQLDRELHALTGKTFTGMGECVRTVECPAEGVIYSYNELIDWHRRTEFREHFGGFQASHRMQVFGCDNDPSSRRMRRDTFAKSLYDKMTESERLKAELFEVITGRVRPLGTTSDE